MPVTFCFLGFRKPTRRLSVFILSQVYLDELISAVRGRYFNFHIFSKLGTSQLCTS